MPLYGATSRNKAYGRGAAASGGSSLPVAGAELWFDGSTLSTYSDGTNITYWKNKGSLGASFDLVNTGSVPNTAGTPSGLLKQTVSSFPCAYSDTSNRVLYFSGWNSNPGVSTGAYYFDGNSGGGTDPNARTFFYVYYSTSGQYLSAFGTYNGNYTTAGYSHNYDNIGFAYLNNYVIVESNDGFPIGTSNGVTIDTSTIAQAGHRQNAGGGTTVSIWKNRTSGFTSVTYSNAAAQTHPVGIGYSRGATVNQGYIFEIIVYGSALSDSQINQVRTYLGTKYGSTANS